jgi:Ca2+-binding RTX toxin-like protein
MKAGLLAALLVLALPSGAGAGFPGANGRLVFTQWAPMTDRFDPPAAFLCTAAPDGGTQSRITGELDDRVVLRDGQPAFSADGSRVVFVRSGISSIFGPLWIATADGSNASQLHGGAASDPAWSPDGRRIYFSEHADLHWISPAGGPSTRLTATAARAELMPEASADGRLVYVETDATAPGPRNLVVADGEAAAPRTLVTIESLRHPSWAPDASTIVFAATDGIWTIGADGRSLRRIREHGEEPQYSPDGTRIAFVDQGDIWTMAPDGTNVRSVTETPFNEMHPTWQRAGGAVAAAGARPCVIAGTRGDDVLVGTNERDIFAGGAGDDVISALGGNDVVIDGDGDDRIDLGDGDDLVFHVAGRNDIAGGAGNDHVSADRNHPIVDEPQVIAGGDGDDELAGGRGRDRIDAGAGDDVISGFRGPDVIFAGPGDDRARGNRGDDYVDGGAGDDVLFGGLTAGPPSDYDGYDVLLGRAGNDRLAGGWQKDRLFGGPGADRLRGGPHADRLVGDAGHDDVGGETGDDLLLARDGTRDVLWGGPGFDRATTDHVDRRAGIERLLRR